MRTCAFWMPSLKTNPQKLLSNMANTSTLKQIIARLDQLGQGPHHLQGNPLTTVPQSKLLLQGAPES